MVYENNMAVQTSSCTKKSIFTIVCKQDNRSFTIKLYINTNIIEMFKMAQFFFVVFFFSDHYIQICFT